MHFDANEIDISFSIANCKKKKLTIKKQKYETNIVKFWNTSFKSNICLNHIEKQPDTEKKSSCKLIYLFNKK